MHDINEYKKYKQALKLLPQIEVILKVLTLAEKALSYYNSYIPVAKILNTIKAEKATLEMYHKSCIKIKENKGKKITTNVIS